MPIKKCSAVTTKKCSARVQGSRRLRPPTTAFDTLRIGASSPTSLHGHLLSPTTAGDAAPPSAGSSPLSPLASDNDVSVDPTSPLPTAHSPAPPSNDRTAG